MAVIDAQAVSKQFLLRHNAAVELKVHFLNVLRRNRHTSVEEFWAVKNVSIRIDRGEAVGLVGRNGSGKSTVLKLVAGIHRPTRGRLLVSRGARICSMIELGIGFHGELTGRENVFLNAAIHGLSRAAIDGIYGAIVAYSGLEHFMDVPIKNYSSGMSMRLGFAIAANLQPDILLLDEIFAVGDGDFQLQCIRTLKRFVEEGKTILFVSHGAGAVRAICRRVCVLEQGELAFDGDVEGGLAFYERSLDGGADGGRALGSGRTGALPDEAPLDRAPHRVESGAHWSDTGAWMFELLRRQGLSPGQFVVEIGCGSLNTAVHLLPFLEQGHYLGIDRNRALLDAGTAIELPRFSVPAGHGVFAVDETFDLSWPPHDFDFALASSLFPYLTFNDIARCIASVVRRLRPSGRFVATWFENPDPADFEPIAQPNGVTTYSDREPFHYPLSLIASVCDAVGATVERVSAGAHPRGESVLVISRRQK